MKPNFSLLYLQEPLVLILSEMNSVPALQCGLFEIYFPD